MGDSQTVNEFVAFARGRSGTGPPDFTLEPLSAHQFVPLPAEALADSWVCKDCGFRAPRNNQHFMNCSQCHGEMRGWFNRGGYEWCIENWGTKWGLYDICVDDADLDVGVIRYTFSTAWSPPTPIIEAMSERFPSLDFAHDYYESGSGFQGHFIYNGGNEGGGWEGPYHGNRGG